MSEVAARTGAWFRRVDRHVALLALLLVFNAVVRIRNVEINLPYPQHVDECTLLSQALRMIRARSANPHEFYKPTLPTYVIITALVAGDGLAVVTGKARGLRELGVVGHGQCQPYFPVRLAVGLAKHVQAAMSLGALALLGFIAYLATRRRPALWLAPLVASLSANFTRHSYLYLNVDIPGALFGLATIAYLLHSHRRQEVPGTAPPGARHALIFGVLAGLTVGSKYNLFPVLVPCSLWFWFHDRRHVIQRVLLLGVTSVATFFVTTPYAILSHREFLRYIDLQQRAYAHGIGNRHDVGRGFPVLAEHVRTFAGNFGWVSLAIALYGAFHLARRDRKTAALLFSYPLAFVAFMCLQVLYFERNSTSVYLLIGLSVSVGLLALFETLLAWLTPRWPRLQHLMPAASAGVLALLVAVSTPWTAVVAAYAPRPDARVQAARWLGRQLTAGTTLLLEENQAELDPRQLPRGVRVESVPEPDSRSWKGWAKKPPGGRGVALVRATHAEAYAEVLGGRVDARRFSKGAPNGKSSAGLALVYF